MSRQKQSRAHNIVMGGIVISLVILLGCVKFEGEKKSTSAAQPELELSAWLADWQWKPSIKEFSSMTDGLSSVQVFAAYFDHTDRLFYTPENVEAIPQIMKIAAKNGSVNVDLSMVNDQFKKDGSAVQKDSELITRLMATVKSRRAHINDIVGMVNEYDFDGVEIDYEKIKDEDWDNVSAFYEELYQKLKSMEKPLRIVLEPRTPIEKLNLPKGPTYVMMAYNLYGSHSGPGPKADFVFIDKMAKKMDQLPGEHVMAFATGGFDWPASGKIMALTEQEAVKLSKRSLQAPKRDAASGAVYFDYLDEKKGKHTVWYADGKTLSQWIGRSQKAGYYKIGLWRLGGFEQTTLDYFNQ